MRQNWVLTRRLGFLSSIAWEGDITALSTLEALRSEFTIYVRLSIHGQYFIRGTKYLGRETENGIQLY
jgi:hypothetical protein